MLICYFWLEWVEGWAVLTEMGKIMGYLNLRVTGRSGVQL